MARSFETSQGGKEQVAIDTKVGNFVHVLYYIFLPMHGGRVWVIHGYLVHGMLRVPTCIHRILQLVSFIELLR